MQFHRQNNSNNAVRYGNILFSVHTITEAKQYAGPGRAEPGLEPGLEPGWWIFQPGHLTWCALV